MRHCSRGYGDGLSARLGLRGQIVAFPLVLVAHAVGDMPSLVDEKQIGDSLSLTIEAKRGSYCGRAGHGQVNLFCRSGSISRKICLEKNSRA